MNKNNNFLYVFLHIPKCAGTTFAKHIKKNFSKGTAIELNVNNLKLKEKKLNYGNYWKATKNFFSEYNLQQKEKVRIIYGHAVPYGIHKIFDRPIRYFAFLRDPASRILFFYNYWRTLYFNELSRNRNKRIYKQTLLINGKIPLFSEWLDKIYDNPKYRIATVSIGNFLQELGYAENLDEFYFVGLTERFDEDSLFLYDLLNIKKFFVNQNVSRNYVSKDDYLKVKEEVFKECKKDYKIYNNALLKNRIFRKENEDYSTIVKTMKIKRRLFLPFTQLVFDFSETLHYSSAVLRSHSKIYSRLIDSLKVKLGK